MATPLLIRPALTGTLVAGALLAPAPAGAAPLEEPPKAELATTGNDSELIESVPIAKQAGTRERVAMSLGPDQLARIERDDRLRVSAEVQFSTTCVEPGPKCVGTPYQVNPVLTARIVLGAAPDRPPAAWRCPRRRRCAASSSARTETTTAR